MKIDDERGSRAKLGLLSTGVTFQHGTARDAEPLYGITVELPRTAESVNHPKVPPNMVWVVYFPYARLVLESADLDVIVVNATLVIR